MTRVQLTLTLLQSKLIRNLRRMYLSPRQVLTVPYNLSTLQLFLLLPRSPGTLDLEDTCPSLWRKASWLPFLRKGSDFPHMQIKISSLNFHTGSQRQTNTISKQQQGSPKRRGPADLIRTDVKPEQPGDNAGALGQSGTILDVPFL